MADKCAYAVVIVVMKLVGSSVAVAAGDVEEEGNEGLLGVNEAMSTVEKCGVGGGK